MSNSKCSLSVLKLAKKNSDKFACHILVSKLKVTANIIRFTFWVLMRGGAICQILSVPETPGHDTELSIYRHLLVFLSFQDTNGQQREGQVSELFGLCQAAVQRRWDQECVQRDVCYTPQRSVM